MPEDADKTKETLKNFHAVYNRLSPEQRDINSYKTLSQVDSVVDPLLGIASSTKVHDLKLPGVYKIWSEGPYNIVEVWDAKSLAILGEGTKWCTRKSSPICQADSYLSQYEKVLILFQNGRPVVQYTPDYEHIMNINNEEVTDPRLLLLILPPEVDVRKYSSVLGYKNSLKIEQRQLYDEFLDDKSNEILLYVKNVIKDRWPAGEQMLLLNLNKNKDGQYPVIQYANSYVGRWPELEHTILKGLDSGLYPMIAVLYASNVLDNRWPEAEPYIQKHHRLWEKYSRLLDNTR